MYVDDGSQQLLENVAELALLLELVLAEAVKGDVFHDQVGGVLAKVEGEGVVADEAGVTQVFDADEVAFEF